MTKNLESMKGVAISGGRKHRPKGWTPERRARQAALIRQWQPWRRSTGPKTEAGKARSSMNAFKHGCRGRVYLHQAARVRYAIRLVAHTNEIARLLIRQRAVHPDLKPTYGLLMTAAVDRLRHFRETAGAEKLKIRAIEQLKAEIAQCNQDAAGRASRPPAFAC